MKGNRVYTVAFFIGFHSVMCKCALICSIP